MKKILFLITVLLSFATLKSQTIDDKLSNISSKIALKLKNKPKFNIAIYPFTSLKTKETNLTLHLFNEFHAALNAKQKSFSLMDRETIENYLAEHQLNSEGLIDKRTAKKFGKLIAADAYVSGKVYIFGSVINLTIKLTDTETGEVISFNSEKIPIDYDMAQFLEIENWEVKKENANLNKSQNPDCNSLNIGNQCFYNNAGVSCEIRIKTKTNYSYKKLVLTKNSKNCFKDLQAGSYSYEVERLDRLRIVSQSNIIAKGFFTIEKCGSQLTNVVNKPIKTISKGNIVNDNFNDNLIVIKIINPNYYARKITFYNRENKSESTIVGSRKSSTINLPKGFYRFESHTTFTNTLVQKGNFNLMNEKSIKLANDNYN